MTNRILIILSISILLFSCKSTQYTPKNYRETQLIVGSGGGVSGMIREYCLLDNGQIFVSKGIAGDWKALKYVKSSKVRSFVNRAKDLGLDTIHFNHPGNMTYYFVYKSGKRSNEIKWGQTDKAIPVNINELYKEIIKAF
ncbi:MAG: hypothetical protein NT004_06025 [Bacteroidetes bacterium]|nr:hypothetical protein [Bacteroidota bacterium]